MVTHCRSRLALYSIALAIAAGIAACDKVPLLAPTGSVITLLPEANTVSLNSDMTIIATVIENGAASGGSGPAAGTSRSGSGTAVQNGTVISFTTTIGTIEPSEARTNNGQVSVRLHTGGTSGTAVVTAFSGGASASINLKVGTAAATKVNVSATPQSLPAAGGTAQVIALVTDDGGSGIGGVPVTFATDHGSVSPTTVNTDATGTATATLTTNGTAKVTATVGGVTSTAFTVTVNPRGLASFTGPATGVATAGTPVVFTVTPTTGANLSNVHVDFGDGAGTDLGPITAATPAPHPYNNAGQFTATATAFDGSGNAGSISTSVSVGSLQVTLSASPTTTTANSPISFTVNGTNNAVVSKYVWTWDDGTPSFSTSGPSTSHSFSGRGNHLVRVDVIGVDGNSLGSASTTVFVS